MEQKVSFFSRYKKDILAGVIVFLIALPLCLGIAQASHAPLFSGIVAGVIGGIVVGCFSRSNLSVSGPAAGLIAIVIGAIEQLKAFEIFLCAVIIAGALQLLLGLLRAGSVAHYFPSNVIEGMLAGIGLTIIIKEIPNAIGYNPPGEIAGMADADDGFVMNTVMTSFGHMELAAVLIAVTGILIMAFWQRLGSRKLKLLPAGLLVVVTGTLINEIFRFSGAPISLDSTHLVNLPVPGNIQEFFGQFRLPDFRGMANPDVWKVGVVIAVIASIETLLCIEATDKLDPLKRYTSGNAELRAQGIGNMLSGFVGGLPITSVIVRSSANINAGGRTKVATITHGMLLLVCVALIPVLLNHIPKASLAAILIYTGYRLCRPAVFRHMWHAGRSQFIPFAATVVAVVSLDLLKGVGIGLVISIFYILRQNMGIPYFYRRSTYSNGDLIKLTLAQEVSFLNKASIKNTLDKLPPNCKVIIDASKTGYIDFDVLDIIRDFAEWKAPAKNIRLSLVGFRNIYNVPGANDESEILADLVDSEEIPQRSAGDHKKLLKQLNGMQHVTMHGQNTNGLQEKTDKQENNAGK